MAFSRKRALAHLANIISYTEKPTPKRISVAARLSHMVASIDPTAEIALMSMDLSAANTREEVMDAFSKANPDLSQEELEAFADNWEKNKDVVKDKADATASGERVTVAQVREIVALTYHEVKAGTITPRAVQERLASLLQRVASDRNPIEEFEEDVIYLERMARLFLKDQSRMNQERMEMEFSQLDTALDVCVKSWRGLFRWGINDHTYRQIEVMLSNQAGGNNSIDMENPAEMAEQAYSMMRTCENIQEELAKYLRKFKQATLFRDNRPREIEIKTLWDPPGSGDPIEVILSGFVSPVMPATMDSPAEGGVESITMTDLSGRMIRMDRATKDWAADTLIEAFGKKHYASTKVASSLKEISKYVARSLSALKAGAIEKAKDELAEAYTLGEDDPETPREVNLQLKDCWAKLKGPNPASGKMELERLISTIRKSLLASLRDP